MRPANLCRFRRDVRRTATAPAGWQAQQAAEDGRGTPHDGTLRSLGPAGRTRGVGAGAATAGPEAGAARRHGALRGARAPAAWTAAPSSATNDHCEADDASSPAARTGSAEGAGSGAASAPTTGARAWRSRRRFRCGFGRGKHRQLLLERSRLALGAGENGVGTHQRLETLSAVLAGVFVDRHVVWLPAAGRRGQHVILRQWRVCRPSARILNDGSTRCADAMHSRGSSAGRHNAYCVGPCPGADFWHSVDCGKPASRAAQATQKRKSPSSFPDGLSLNFRLLSLVSGALRKKARRND